LTAAILRCSDATNSGAMPYVMFRKRWILKKSDKGTGME